MDSTKLAWPSTDADDGLRWELAKLHAYSRVQLRLSRKAFDMLEVSQRAATSLVASSLISPIRAACLPAVKRLFCFLSFAPC